MTPAFRMRKLRKNYQKIVRTVSEKEEKPGQCDVLQSQVKKKNVSCKKQWSTDDR